MSLHANQFTAMSGLRFDKQSQTYWGNPSGYPVFVTVQPRRDSVIFRLIGKLRDESQNTAMQGAVTEFTASHTGVSGCSGVSAAWPPRANSSRQIKNTKITFFFDFIFFSIPFFIIFRSL